MGPLAVSPQILPPPQFGTKPGLNKKLKDPSAHRISEATWKLVNKAKDSSNDKAQEDMKDIAETNKLAVIFCH